MYFQALDGENLTIQNLPSLSQKTNDSIYRLIKQIKEIGTVPFAERSIGTIGFREGIVEWFCVDRNCGLMSCKIPYMGAGKFSQVGNGLEPGPPNIKIIGPILHVGPKKSNSRIGLQH